jgi:hypothetical protein
VLISEGEKEASFILDCDNYKLVICRIVSGGKTPILDNKKAQKQSFRAQVQSYFLDTLSQNSNPQAP